MEVYFTPRRSRGSDRIEHPVWFRAPPKPAGLASRRFRACSSITLTGGRHWAIPR